MIKLYCISVFLQSETINTVLEFCNAHAMNYQEIDITDQVGETVKGCQLSIDNLKILLLPCNDFHTHKDFELGITTDTKENWQHFIKNLQQYTEIEYGQCADDGAEYALIQDEALHGPFFFIFDRHNSNIEPLVRLKCTIQAYDYTVYKEKIEPFLGEALLKRITIQSGTAFCIEAIMIKTTAGTVSLTF